MKPRPAARLPLSLACLLLACADPAPTAAPADAAPPALPTAATASATPPAVAPAPSAPPPSALARPQAGDTVAVAAGALRVGSLPGTPARRPSVEADLAPVTIPAYDIDRLPFPNDPARAPQLAGTRAEAAALCESRGRRLCHELEWERACRGDTEQTFATGDAMDHAACLADRAACPSPIGVLDLGVRAPEWTASDAERALARLERTAVVRGAGADEELSAHRCGARQVRSPAGGGPALAFRCCGGSAPELPYPAVGGRRMFRDLDHDTERWRTIFRSVPQLAPYADDFEPYGEADALRALARGDATEADMQWELARAPFAWSPSPGEEVWVVAGHAGERTVLAAIYPLPDGRSVHAASFVLADEAAPVALLRTRTTRHELIWSTCWGCMGESGVIRFGEDATILIVQQ